ncbi:MAG: NADH:ubiquinone oxidoreductase subunit NDUFA12 [Proteobacteria bacterium]|nr:NADH:ubiquinone oxidoreductase subunit NDUFA12 [Pseudomonadota bacterium]MDA1132564.1 NADH:ubiquinone oxidoreductase subunit NDUFA12 [Pseudomonadota bacterium]
MNPVSRLIAIFFSWWKNPPLGTSLFSWFNGERVGTDPYGNRYFRERGAGDAGRRWVMYAGDIEASKVPAGWHAWLHRTTNALPSPDRRAYEWEKPHLPNQTGTAAAYRPPGSLSAAGERPRATGDYEPWRPS